MSDSMTMKEALMLDISELRHQLAAAMHERDEAVIARKASAADWLNQVEQANARVSRALQQVALAERERDEAMKERDETRADCERLNRLLRAETSLGQGEIDHWAALEREREEARAWSRQWKKAAKDWRGLFLDWYLRKWKRLERERDEARETVLKLRRDCSLQNEVIESLRDQLCADKCREKAAADGGWANI